MAKWVTQALYSLVPFTEVPNLAQPKRAHGVLKLARKEAAAVAALRWLPSAQRAVGSKPMVPFSRIHRPVLAIWGTYLAVSQNQWYHFGAGAPPGFRTLFSGGSGEVHGG